MAGLRKAMQASNWFNTDTHIINLVEQILTDAINKNASDIHFELYAKNYRIRFRIDGILHEMMNLDPRFANRIVARLKIMSNLDIAERRMPQDGYFNGTLGKKYDCRISTCPTLYGEKIVIRILNTCDSLLGIDDLGLELSQQKLFLDAINRPQGIILITGPTGSGKTVTLYAALNALNHNNKNISTVEDPVEINLRGINQVNIHSKIGLNFATILRSFLRQDPDIIMLGEIRDLETAEIAVKASQTGHLVFSTLHTNSAAESIVRLLNIGISTFNIDSSLTLVVHQRLVRKLCPCCKYPEQTPYEHSLIAGFAKNELNFIPYTAAGCNKCNNGFKGRIGIFEILPISLHISEMIMQRKSAAAIFQKACAEGMISLRRSALNKVRQGITSFAEINRIL